MKNIDKKIEKEKKEFTDANDRFWKLLMRKANNRIFKSDIKNLRKEFDIPPDGFTERPLDFEVFSYVSFRVPLEWQGKIGKDGFSSFYYKLMDIANKHKFGPLIAHPKVFLWIAIYNEYLLPQEVGMVALEDMVKVKQEIRFGNLKENYIFPVALLISPHATKAEIVDFVETHFNRIERIQYKYKEKTPPFSRVRRKKTLGYTNFILKHRDIPPKELAIMVNKKFKNLNYTDTDVRKTIDHHT